MTKTKLTTILSILAMSGPALLAEEPATKCAMCDVMKKHAAEGQQQKLEMEAKTQIADLDKLVAEMNGTTGKDKIEAMAAVVTRLVAHYKAMTETTAIAPKAEGTPEVPVEEAHQHEHGKD